MNLNHLSVFHAVAETGAVTGAAERLMVSQPAVSKQLRLLERELGVELFERGAKGMRATEAGETLAGYARRIFGLADEADQAMDDLHWLRRGRLAIAASATVGAYLLPKLLVRFRQRFPGIDVRVEVEGGAVLRRRVEERAVDFGMTEAKVEGVGFNVRTFMEDELVVIVPRGHRLAQKRGGVSVAEVRAEPLVARDAGSEGASLVERTLGVAGGKVLVLGSTEAVKEAVAEGLGVAVVPRMTVGAELAARRLEVVKVKGGLPRRAFHYVRLEGRRESKAEHAFGCLLKHVARGALPPLGGRQRGEDRQA